LSKTAADPRPIYTIVIVMLRSLLCLQPPPCWTTQLWKMTYQKRGSIRKQTHVLANFRCQCSKPRCLRNHSRNHVAQGLRVATAVYPSQRHPPRPCQPQTLTTKITSQAVAVLRMLSLNRPTVLHALQCSIYGLTRPCIAPVTWAMVCLTPDQVFMTTSKQNFKHDSIRTSTKR
jgi:hypothetical protein